MLGMWVLVGSIFPFLSVVVGSDVDIRIRLSSIRFQYRVLVLLLRVVSLSNWGKIDFGMMMCRALGH